MFLRQSAANFLRKIRFSSQFLSPSRATTTDSSLIPLSSISQMKFTYNNGSRGYNWRRIHWDPHLWIVLCGQAVIFLGINTNPVLARDAATEGFESDKDGANVSVLQKIEDGSVISNVHTSKWRVFTDHGRDLFLQGKPEEAEKYFLLAIEEAKEGFGERDPHVASACNNLAELYRVKKAFDKAEPLYLEAIKILEESFGPEDIRVAAACHNLGKFYLVRRKLEEAHICYERSLEIKRRVLGHAHLDYADTMYHLGTVLYLQGKEKDSEALIQDSIRILEENGQGESAICIRRLKYLAQIYIKSNRPAEAENVQRKILHVMELSKGWNSLETVFAAEGLALTLQSNGNLREAQELLQRCLDACKSLLPADHIQIGANMLRIARVAMLNSNQLQKKNTSEAIAELDKAKDLIDASIRIAQQISNNLRKQKGYLHKFGKSEEPLNDGHATLVILLQSLDALGLLEISKKKLQESEEELPSPVPAAEKAFLRCISAYKEFGTHRSVSESPEVKVEYLKCLKNLSRLINSGTNRETKQTRRPSSQELEDEITRIEIELSSYKKRKN